MTDSIKLDLQDIRWEGVDRIRPGEDRYSWPALANRVIYLKYLRSGY
jgi:hypothetical protein